MTEQDKARIAAIRERLTDIRQADNLRDLAIAMGEIQANAATDLATLRARLTVVEQERDAALAERAAVAALVAAARAWGTKRASHRVRAEYGEPEFDQTIIGLMMLDALAAAVRALDAPAAREEQG